MNIFTHFGSFCETFFAGTAQEAGAGGRSGAAGSPVHGSLMGCFSLCIWLPSLFSWSTVALWLALWCYQVKPSARWHCSGHQHRFKGWYGQVGVFLEAFSKWAFGFTYVHVCRVLVACYLVYDPTLLVFRRLVFRVYEDGS